VSIIHENENGKCKTCACHSSNEQKPTNKISTFMIIVKGRIGAHDVVKKNFTRKPRGCKR